MSAPLPENPANPLLMKMLVPAPYQAPAKKDKKKKNTKEAQGDLHPEETSRAVSGGTEAPSSGEEDEDKDEGEGEVEEGEELEDPPSKGKKRAASVDPEEGMSKRGRVSPFDDLDSHTEVVPK